MITAATSNTADFSSRPVSFNDGALEVVRFGPNSADTTLPISVVVATYNRGARLGDLLADLASQARDSDRFGDPAAGVGDQPEIESWFEVILVDDGGSDPALPFVEAHVALVPPPFPLTVVRRSNGGPGQARSTGISMASGEVVVIVDDDMRFGPHFLGAHLVEYAPSAGMNGKAPADVVLGYIAAESDTSELPVFERFHLDSLERFVQSVRDGEAHVDGSRLCTGNVSFRKRAYDEVGGFDLSLRRCEDRDLGLRFEVAGFRIVFSLAARSEHRTDHHDVNEWRTRSRLFGELDTVIARKHPNHRSASPWSFLPLLPVPVRPLMVAAALFPVIGRSLAGPVYRVAVGVDRKRLGIAIALQLATLCYGLDYYAGVGSAFPTHRRPLAVLGSVRSFFGKNRR